MAEFIGLDVSQKLTRSASLTILVGRLWRGQCHSEPEPIERAVRRHAGDDARHARAALKMQMNKTDQNDACQSARA
jgi:transposase